LEEPGSRPMAGWLARRRRACPPGFVG
jgi:hypothetical protein